MGEHDQRDEHSHDSEHEPGPRENSDATTQSDAGLTGSPSFAATAGPAADVPGDVDPEEVLGGDDEDDEDDADDADQGDEPT